MLCREPFVAAVCSQCFRVVGNNFAAEEFAELRSKLHTSKPRAGQLQGKRLPSPCGSASPEDRCVSPNAQDLLGCHSSLPRPTRMKAMRRRIALQSTSCEMHERR